MDKSAKKEALEMTEQIMKLSLYYCKDEDDEIAAYSIRVNSEARRLQKLIERYLTDQTRS
tara:strand:+ start:385 stop:564 length:180 start_codon:yes stop_codon:yes gene_type:complete